MKKKYFRFLSLAFFLLGIFFLLNSKINVTGAVVGVLDISSGISSIFGIAFILISFVLLIVNKDLERLLGIHDYENDTDYQALKRDLEKQEKSIGGKRNYAQEILDRGKYIEKTRDLTKIAIKMGYTLEKGYKEGTRVYNGDDVITVIPSHRTIGGPGTSKSILRALATGESSFRK